MFKCTSNIIMIKLLIIVENILKKNAFGPFCASFSMQNSIL